MELNQAAIAAIRYHRAVYFSAIADMKDAFHKRDLRAEVEAERLRALEVLNPETVGFISASARTDARAEYDALAGGFYREVFQPNARV